MSFEIDIVCGMQVNSKKAKYKTIYKGKIYYFCSSACKRAFASNPEYYIEHGPTGHPD
ncbi:YHS domain-containing protein [Infirmifilum uzonense]|uniref:YHS domain-containing protein n=1 Tax=Infirmifilum uzonense TaxID=1550241 RepID=UPI000A99836E